MVKCRGDKGHRVWGEYVPKSEDYAHSRGEKKVRVSAACVVHRCLVSLLVFLAVIRHPTLQVTFNLFFIACLLRIACVFSLVLAHHPSLQKLP